VLTTANPRETLVHADARLTVHGRRLPIERIQSGGPVVHVAAEMGVSAATAWKWWRASNLGARRAKPARVDGPPDRPGDPPYEMTRPGELIHLDVKKLGEFIDSRRRQVFPGRDFVPW
jgi:transposase-like protein